MCSIDTETYRWGTRRVRRPKPAATNYVAMMRLGGKKE